MLIVSPIQLLFTLLLIGINVAAGSPRLTMGGGSILAVRSPLSINTAGGDLETMGCKGPTSDVRLRMVNQLEYLDRRFILSLHNNSQLPIRLLALGSGKFRVWKADPGSEPESIVSPLGWRGRLTFEHEGSHMTIVWMALEVESYVSPGDDLSGFGFTLPASADEPLGLPFQVVFSSGDVTCVWGHLVRDQK